MKKIFFLFCAIVFSLKANAQMVADYNGSLFFEAKDVFFEGLNLPFEFSRIYNSALSDLTEISVLSDSWRHNFEYKTVFNPLNKELLLKTPDGAVININNYKKNENGFIFSPLDNYNMYFDYQGFLTAIENVYGQKIDFAYNQDGLLIKANAPYNQYLTFSYNEMKYLEKIESSFGDDVSFFYNDNKLQNVYFNNELIETYLYQNNKLTSINQTKIGSWYMEYNEEGKVSSITNPQNIKYFHEYSSKGDSITHRIKRADGSLVTKTKNLKNNTSQTIDEEGGITTTSFNPKTLLPEFIIDANHNKTTFSWDSLKRLTSTKDALNQETMFFYKEKEEFPYKIQKPDKSITEIQTDKYGNIINWVDNYGKHSFSWDNLGRITSYSDVYGNTNLYEYENNWLPSKFIDGKDEFLKISFDKNGKPQDFIFNQQSKKTAYEINKNIQEIAAANLENIKKMMPNIQQKSKDGLSSFVIGDNLKTILIELTDKTKINFDYNKKGLISNKTIDKKKVEGFEYDKKGNVITRLDAYNKRTKYKYDAIDRLIEVSLPEKGQNISFSYDANNRLKTAQRGKYQHSFDYDKKGNKIKTDINFDNNKHQSSIFYEYDRFDRKTSIKNDNHNIEYIRNKNGKIQEIHSNLLGKFSINYHSNGELKEIIYPNNVKTNISLFKNNILSQTIDIPKDGKYVLTLKKDNQGQTIYKKHNDVENNYVYDADLQLINAQIGENKFSYNYDSFGNLVKSNKDVFDYAKMGKIKSKQELVFDFDNNGNLIENKGKVTNQYRFSSDNKLISATTANNDKIEFFYDAFGLPIARSKNKTKTIYIKDNLNPLSEIFFDDDGNQVVRNYVYSDGIGEILGMEENGKLFYFHRNELNSVILITDENGQKTAEYLYSPYGEILNASGAFLSPILFAGHTYDKDLDLYQMNYRFYDSKIKRFLSPDPIKGHIHIARTMNPYLYAVNNPINYNDPLGLWSIPSWVPFVGGVRESGNNGIQAMTQATKKASLTANQQINKNDKLGELSEILIDPILGGYNKFSLDNNLANTSAQLMTGAGISAFQNIAEVVVNSGGLEAIDYTRAADTLGNASNVMFHSFAVANIAHKQQKGEITQKEAYNMITGETAGAIFSTGTAFAASKIGAASGGLATTSAKVLLKACASGAGAAIGTGLVTAWSAGQVKNAVVEGMSAYDAEVLARKLDKAVPENLRFSAMTVVQSAYDTIEQAERAIAGGDINKANELLKETLNKQQGIEEYIEKHNVSGLYDLTDDIRQRFRNLSDARSQLSRSMFEQKEAEKQASIKMIEDDKNNETEITRERPKIRFSDDVDYQTQAQYKNQIERERQQNLQQIANQAQTVTQKQEQEHLQAMQNLAQGVQVFQQGLTQAVGQYQEYNKQHEAVTRQNREQTQNAIQQTIGNQQQHKQQFNAEYGNVLKQQGYIATGQVIPKGDLGARQVQQQSTTSYNQPSQTKPQKPRFEGISSTETSTANQTKEYRTKWEGTEIVFSSKDAYDSRLKCCQETNHYFGFSPEDKQEYTYYCITGHWKDTSGCRRFK